MILCADSLRQRPADDSARDILLKVNDRFLFELNKVGYTLGYFRRGTLIDEIDQYTKTLDKFLSLQDGMLRHAATPFTSARSKDRTKYAKLAAFWKHASRIFCLMHSAWRCSCVSLHCVYIPVHQDTTSRRICLELLLKYRSDINPVQSCPWRTVPLSIDHFDIQSGSIPFRPKRAERFGQLDSVVGASATQGTAVLANTSGSNTLQLLRAGELPQAMSSNNSPPGITPTATAQGLCHLAVKSQAAVLGSHIHTLSDDSTNDAYRLVTTTTAIHDGLIYNLTDILKRRCTLELYHGPRLSIAHAISVSFLQLYTTPWLNESEMSTSIHVPVSEDGKRLLHEQAFVLSHFLHNPHPDDSVFALLGILLLELCYNKPLEEHDSFKSRPESKNDPLIRKAVAVEWAKDVEYQWNEEGARAIGWCLHNASSRSEGWRMKFATNVVEPLKTLCDQAGPNQSGNALLPPVF